MHSIQTVHGHYTLVLFNALVWFVVVVHFQYSHNYYHHSGSHLTLTLWKWAWKVAPSLFVIPADSRYPGRGLISCVPPTPQNHHPQWVSRAKTPLVRLCQLEMKQLYFLAFTLWTKYVRRNLFFHCWWAISVPSEGSVKPFKNPNNYSEVVWNFRVLRHYSVSKGKSASSLQNNWNLSAHLQSFYLNSSSPFDFLFSFGKDLSFLIYSSN